MNSVVSFDTNLLVRMLITRENPAQSEAIARATEWYQSIHLADLAITESVFVLTNYYQLERAAVAKFFGAIFTDPTFQCNAKLFQKALHYYVTHPALSFEDCYLAVCADLNNAAPLLTFDRKLAHQLPEAELLPV